MTNGTTPAARLLFVIDNDFGALGTILYLLYRQPISTRATLLLPPRAYEMHEGRLPMASRPYRSLQDILDVVESESPDVVCLVSGYLFASSGLLTINALRKLVRTLRERGCKVATTDPYFGTFREIAKADLPARHGAIHRFVERYLVKLPAVYGLAARVVKFYNRKKLERDVYRVADILKDVTHFDPVRIDPLDAGVRRIPFFNPLYVRTEEELRANSAVVSALPDVSQGRPRWLFVLAKFDLEFQEKKYGKQGFVDIVVAKIRETIDNGRHATFIGPAGVTEALLTRFPGDTRVSLLPYCSFDEFERRLLDAEIAFYWQIFSTSAFLRLWNGLPVFFFDPGHNAHLLSSLHETGLKYFYLAGPPIYLDVERPLDATALIQPGIDFRQSARDIFERLARLPTPADMVNALRDTARRAP